MIVREIVRMACLGDSVSACSDACLLKIGHRPTFRLKRERAGEVIHGSVSMTHGTNDEWAQFYPEPPPQGTVLTHAIVLEVFDEDAPPDKSPVNERRLLKRPLPMPTEKTLRTRLATLKEAHATD